MQQKIIIFDYMVNVERLNSAVPLRSVGEGCSFPLEGEATELALVIRLNLGGQGVWLSLKQLRAEMEKNMIFSTCIWYTLSAEKSNPIDNVQ